MVNGRIVCYGPPEYLKHEYGRGLKVILHSTNVDISRFIETCPFLNAEVEMEGKLVFSINTQLLVSQMFKSVRDALNDQGMSNVVFEILHSSLTDVFKDFLKPLEKIRMDQDPNDLDESKKLI